MCPPEFVCQTDQEFFRSLYETQKNWNAEKTRILSEETKKEPDNVGAILKRVYKCFRCHMDS
jgi:hypothetical protein